MTEKPSKAAKKLPNVEQIQEELSRIESIDDFFGKEGVFANLFAQTIEEMLEAAPRGFPSEHLGYEKYEAKGRNSGNNRNGKRKRQIETSAGSQTIEVPRGRNGSLESPLLDGKRSNELEQKITSLYAKGTSTRDIQGMIAEIYGVKIIAAVLRFSIL